MPTLEDLQRQMLELQRQMQQQFGQLNDERSTFKWDTSFNFEFDTSGIGGQGFQGKFFFNGDSTQMGGNFFNLGDVFGRLFDQNGDPNSGNMWFGFPEQRKEEEENDDSGLTPEEKLRLEEEEETTGKKAPAATNPATQKPKLKSIRI